MEIGNQIKALRQRRGVTQEDLARHLGVTAQAVSKWERCAATPDIALLPALSAYFGVTIDELFALSDDTRMERIQNMLWDVRFLSPADADSSRQFLLDKARREPHNGRPLELLADLENHLAKEHHTHAAEYAREALRRDPDLQEVHGELKLSMGGWCKDWAYNNHTALIEFYKDYLRTHPTCKNAYLHLLDNLLDDFRLTEAQQYLDSYAKLDDSYRIPMYRGLIEWFSGNRAEAFDIWAKMEEDHPGNWYVYQNIGDFLVRSERYAEAIPYYRKALDAMGPPRWCDPIESIAQVYELMGDLPAAIDAWREELSMFDSDWGFTTGETADVVHRRIARLEAKLNRTIPA